MFSWCRQTVERPVFQYAVIVIIVLNAILVGLETSKTLVASYDDLFDGINYFIQALFVIEILIRFFACHPNFGNFFRNGWNLFDVTVVALSYIPAVGTFATVARLARVMRVTRLIAFSSELRLVVDTMLRSIPSMGHVILMLGLLVYVYAVLGIHLFRDDPNIEMGKERFEDIWAAMWTMFHTITFENWVAVQEPITRANPWGGRLYFFSFIIIGVFIGINMFVAVVMNNLEEVKEEHAREQTMPRGYREILDRVQQMKSHIEDLEAALQKLGSDEQKSRQG